MSSQEFPRRGRQCAPGDLVASVESLEHAVQNGPLSIIRMGEDGYARTLALVPAGETKWVGLIPPFE